MSNKVEILAPGGDANSVKAAIIAGADAVYLGLQKFNARKRATNIDLKVLSELINIAHSKNVKIFVTMNILFPENEIQEVLSTAVEIFNLGVDAVIVQDPGFAYLLKQYLPDFEVHASTQMTTHNSYQIDFLKKLGIKQLNFSRELSSEELKPLIKESKLKEIKTEIFVHGAYCISCSGICYMSSVISAQPGNRGACLQPCRRQYGTEENSTKDYLLSLKDNNAILHAEELINEGTDTLKIEGRIKNFNYVYNVTETWRKKVDSIYGYTNISEKNLQTNLQKVFNRDFSVGYYENEISANMFIESPLDQSQTVLGKVENYNAKDSQLFFNSSIVIKPNDRINIYTAENRFICGAIIKNKINNNSYKIEIENQLKGKILKGQIVLLLSNNNEIENIKNRIDELKITKKIIDAIISGKNNEYLKANFIYNNISKKVQSNSLLTLAQKKGLDKSSLENQFGRLGDTDFKLGNVNTDQLDENLFIPVKELNNMRRDAISFFESPKIEISFSTKTKSKVSTNKKLTLLFSTTEQIPPSIKDSNYDLFIELTTATNKKHIPENSNLWVPPFILDSEFDTITNLIKEINPKNIISDNSGIGNWCGENNFDWVAGPQLNCTNSYSFETYKNIGKASGAFYSSEINKEQINSFSLPENFKSFYSVFGPMILMTTRQCLFLKPGLCPFEKTQVDKACLKVCNNYSEFFDEKSIPFHIIKTSGHIHRIFNDRILFIPEAIKEISADYFLLDFRNLPFYDFNHSKIETIISFFQNIIESKKIEKNSLKEIKKLVGKITRGNYLRGFE